MSDPDGIFCKIVAGELPAQIVDEDEHTIAFMDIAPATRGCRSWTPWPERWRGLDPRSVSGRRAS